MLTSNQLKFALKWKPPCVFLYQWPNWIIFWTEIPPGNISNIPWKYLKHISPVSWPMTIYPLPSAIYPVILGKFHCMVHVSNKILPKIGQQCSLKSIIYRLTPTAKTNAMVKIEKKKNKIFGENQPGRSSYKGRMASPKRMNFWKSSKRGGEGSFPIQKFILQIFAIINAS